MNSPGEVVRCNVCSTAVDPADFDRGRAARVLGQIYCATCIVESIRKSRDPGAPPQFETPRPRPLRKPQA